MTKTEELLAEKSDVRLLVDKLDIDESDIITAAKEQPGLYIKAARYRVQKMRRRIRLESNFDLVRTDLSLKIRARDKKLQSKKPITETNIKELLSKDPDYLQAQEDLNKAIEEEEFAKRLLDGYDHRGKSIRVVADLIGAEVALERKMGEYNDLVNLKTEGKNEISGDTLMANFDLVVTPLELSLIYFFVAMLILWATMRLAVFMIEGMVVRLMERFLVVVLTNVLKEYWLSKKKFLEDLSGDASKLNSLN